MIRLPKQLGAPGARAPVEGPPPRWWSEAEVRSVLGRRAVLDSVVVTSTSRDGGVGWGCRYSVDGGRSELSATVVTCADEAVAVDLLSSTDAVRVGVRGVDDAALASISDDDGGPRHRLVVRCGRQVRSIELVLRTPERASARGRLDVGRSLVRLHQLLWA